MRKSYFEFKLLLGLMIILIISWITVIFFITTTAMSIILNGIILLLLGAILIQGILEVPNDPPSFGMVIRFGVRDWTRKEKIVFLNEGLGWVFLRGFVFKVIPVDIQKRQVEFDPQDVLTPDNVSEKFPVSLAYMPDRYDYLTFLNIKKDEGVVKSLKEQIESEVRKWSRHPTEGPQSWEEIIKSSLKAIDFLAKSLGKYLPNNKEEIIPKYDYFEKLDSSIPTPILMDWFQKKDPPNAIIRKKYGDGEDFEKDFNPQTRWQKLDNMLPSTLTNQCTKEKLEGQIQKRIKLLTKLKDNNANVPTVALGIVLSRLSITDIKPFGPIYEASIELQKEEKQRKSEEFETNTNVSKAKILKKALEDSGETNVSFGECFNAIMKWQMFKDGKGFVYEGSLGNFAGLGDLISSIMKGGKK